jgi:hypothetical protein
VFDLDLGGGRLVSEEAADARVAAQLEDLDPVGGALALA